MVLQRCSARDADIKVMGRKSEPQPLICQIKGFPVRKAKVALVNVADARETLLGESENIPLQDDVQVDYRLGSHPGNGSAADVFYLMRHISQDRLNSGSK